MENRLKQCLGKSAKEKKFSVTYYREEYERNIARVSSSQGRYMKGKRQSTVELVFGTLTQFMGMRKINTLGIKQANKVMHMAAMAYNLKKYLKFTQKRVVSRAKALRFYCTQKIIVLQSILSFYIPFNFYIIYY
ncbi:MAG: transposase [Cellulophaga sp.]